jgi:uncharacterized protein YjbI with pentapeptide repeats
MFTFIPCAAGCGRPAITGSNVCAVHSANTQAASARIIQYISEQKTVTDLNAQYLHFDDADFSGCRFYGCTFQNAVFFRCSFASSFMRLCFFDFAKFTKCSFEKSDLAFVSFAGADIRHSTFQSSEIQSVNYGGCTISHVVFDNSNLYNSRFIEADIADTSIIDCNIKRVYFINTGRPKGKLPASVTIKSCNNAEAVFTMEQF